MNASLHYDLMQARHHDLARSAAQHRLAAEVKAAKAQTAGRARRDGAAAAQRRHVLPLIWRLLPA